MKILLLFNEAYNGQCKYDLTNSLQIHEMIKNTNPEELIVCTGPSQYTACRKNISLALGWSYDNSIKTFGFNLLKHFINKEKCFIVKNKLIWTKNKDQYNIVNINQFPNLDLKEYTGNIDLFNNPIKDCSIENIWNYIDELKKDLNQEYYDKFSFTI